MTIFDAIRRDNDRRNSQRCLWTQLLSSGSILFALIFPAYGDASGATAKLDYNMNAVCLFIQLLEYQNLPKIEELDYENDKRIRKLRSVYDTTFDKNIDAYEYKDKTTLAEVARSGEKSFYTHVKIDASALPVLLRSKTGLFPYFDIRGPADRANEISLGCDCLEAKFSFDGEMLKYIEVDTGCD